MTKLPFLATRPIASIGPAEKETAVERPTAGHRRLERRPVLNDPIQLIGPASLVGNLRDLSQDGTDDSNPVLSSSESKPAPLWWVSSRFRATAGIWPYGRGTIDRPAYTTAVKTACGYDFPRGATSALYGKPKLERSRSGFSTTGVEIFAEADCETHATVADLLSQAVVSWRKILSFSILA